MGNNVEFTTLLGGLYRNIQGNGKDDADWPQLPSIAWILPPIINSWIPSLT